MIEEDNMQFDCANAETLAADAAVKWTKVEENKAADAKDVTSNAQGSFDTTGRHGSESEGTRRSGAVSPGQKRRSVSSEPSPAPYPSLRTGGRGQQKMSMNPDITKLAARIERLERTQEQIDVLHRRQTELAARFAIAEANNDNTLLRCEIKSNHKTGREIAVAARATSGADRDECGHQTCCEESRGTVQRDV